MCGIAGAFGHIDTDIEDAVRAASKREAHRGPDAYGVWTSAPIPTGPGAVLEHRRLAIIDLTDRADQPMLDARNGNVLCFNGEIYNFRALRHELEVAGNTFETDSDTEVVLKAYSTWGENCVTRLRGMFAFALWDHSDRRILLARDRIGIKPLYLAEVDRGDTRRTVLFASELRALLATGLIERRIDPVGLSSYVWNGFVSGPGTIVRGIRQLRPGHTAWLSGPSCVSERRFWQTPTAKIGSVGQAELRSRLEESVRQHLASDVPVGIFLSGGVDSSAIAAMASRVSSRPLRTFTLCFEQSRFDESPYARRVAEAVGSTHEEVELRQRDVQTELESALGSLDQPTFDGINTYFVSRAVREAGIKVALSGAGGDELFGGYRSFVDIPLAAAWSRRLDKLPRPLLRALSGAASRMLNGRSRTVPRQTRWGKLGDALATRGEHLPLYQVRYALFSRHFVGRLQNVEVPEGLRYGLPSQRFEQLALELNEEPELHAISMMELEFFLGDRLLRDTDSASMGVSLEVRVPLLDHEVIEAVSGLDLALRFQPLGEKRALRESALMGLDSALFERPKAGFELPLETWTRQSLRGEIDSHFADIDRCESVGLSASCVKLLWEAYQAGAPGLYWSRIWSLFTLLHWSKVHRVTI